MTTTDLGEFGFRELKEAGAILSAYGNGKLTSVAREFFDEDEVRVCMNQNSGYVFLTNSEYQALMLNDAGQLELWINLSYHGSEGFLEDLVDDAKSGMELEDIEELLENYEDFIQDEDIKELTKIISNY